MRAPTSLLLLVTLLLSAPLIAFGARMRLFEARTANGFIFDVMAESSLGMSNGFRDAYDGCYMLRVNGAEVRAPGVTILYGGRGVQMPRQDVGGITVSRQVYIPSEGDWARYYDLVINSSKKVQTVQVEIYGNLGSDSSTKIVGTSDQDSLIENSDTWFSTDDSSDGGGDPTLAHVFRRARGKLRPQSVSLNRDSISIHYQLKLAPRARAALVFFAVQAKNGTDAMRTAQELVVFGTKAKARLSAQDIRYIRN
jgi:hypothetical protein